ncbi:MAG: DUF1565 domain-containing protein [Anaerorhabdus sp.]|uniref:DUF1565 domain-containing protein n=1 Tax=Anaerorhabdus sp. TaxID=1872524 RepID=UPI003A8C32DE
MADVKYTTVTLTANIPEAVSITPVSLYSEIPMQFNGKFSVVVQEGYVIENYEINSSIYTIEQMETLILDESNSTRFNSQTNEYIHEITIHLVGISTNEIKYLSLSGLRYFFDKIKTASINKLGLVKAPNSSYNPIRVDTTGLITFNNVLTPVRESYSHNFFVSTTGSDDNPGTEALPFKTIKKAIEKISACPGGTTIKLFPGEYSEGTLFLNGYIGLGSGLYNSGSIALNSYNENDKPIIKDTVIEIKSCYVSLTISNIIFQNITNGINDKRIFILRNVPSIWFYRCSFTVENGSSAIINPVEEVGSIRMNDCTVNGNTLFPTTNAFALRCIYLIANTGNLVKMGDLLGVTSYTYNNTIIFSESGASVIATKSIDVNNFINSYVIEKNGSTAGIPVNSIIFEKE